MNGFDKEKLSNLLIKAQGDRTREKYADDAGVSLPQVSKFIKMENSGPPRPLTLKKLAEAAHNGVTYEDLMIAAGHISKKHALQSEKNSDSSEDKIPVLDDPKVRALARRSLRKDPSKEALLKRLINSMLEEE